MKIVLFLILALGVVFLLHDRSELQSELAETRARLEKAETELQAAKKKATAPRPPAPTGLDRGGSAPTPAGSDWFSRQVEEGRHALDAPKPTR